MNDAQIIQVLVSLIGGGLAGGILTILYNWLSSRLRSGLKQTATIAALRGELGLAALICEVNGRDKGKILPRYTRLPSLVAARVAFAERDLYPLLRPLHSDIELYVLAATHINELINFYFNLLLSPRDIQLVAADYTNEIADYCIGKKSLTHLAPNNTLTLPELITAQIRKLELIINKK